MAAAALGLAAWLLVRVASSAGGDPTTWTVQDTQAWITTLGFPELAPAFAEVPGSQLSKLDDRALESRQLICSADQRRVIARSIDDLLKDAGRRRGSKAPRRALGAVWTPDHEAMTAARAAMLGPRPPSATWDGESGPRPGPHGAVEDWSVADVGVWLDDVGLSALRGALKGARISGRRLIELTSTEAIARAVAAVKEPLHRLALAQEIQALKAC